MTDVDLLGRVLAKHDLDNIMFRRNEFESDVEFAARFIDVVAPFLHQFGAMDLIAFTHALNASQVAPEWRSSELMQ